MPNVKGLIYCCATFLFIRRIEFNCLLQSAIVNTIITWSDRYKGKSHELFYYQRKSIHLVITQVGRSVLQLNFSTPPESIINIKSMMWHHNNAFENKIKKKKQENETAQIHLYKKKEEKNKTLTLLEEVLYGSTQKI